MPQRSSRRRAEQRNAVERKGKRRHPATPLLSAHKTCSGTHVSVAPILRTRTVKDSHPRHVSRVSRGGRRFLQDQLQYAHHPTPSREAQWYGACCHPLCQRLQSRRRANSRHPAYSMCSKVFCRIALPRRDEVSSRDFRVQNKSAVFARS